MTRQELRENLAEELVDRYGEPENQELFEKMLDNLDHLIDEYVGQEHLLTAGDGTSLKCSCGKTFGSTDEANQHQQWHLELETRRRAGIGEK